MLEGMYEDFMLQALSLGINDDKLKRKLFDDAGGDDDLGLEQAIKKCRIVETTKNDMAEIQTNESVQFVSTKQHNQAKSPTTQQDEDDQRSARSKKPTNESTYENCGRSHPLQKCPAFGQQCHTCKKNNHWKFQCRSKRQVNVVEDDIDEQESKSQTLIK